jgi:hypothetical protein
MRGGVQEADGFGVPYAIQLLLGGRVDKGGKEISNLVERRVVQSEWAILV